MAEDGTEMMVEAVEEGDSGWFRIQFKPGMVCPIEGCGPEPHPSLRKFKQHWERLHMPLQNIKICESCPRRVAFKRTTDLRAHCRQVHGLGESEVERMVAETDSVSVTNRNYIDPGAFLPPRKEVLGSLEQMNRLPSPVQGATVCPNILSVEDAPGALTTSTPNLSEDAPSALATSTPKNVEDAPGALTTSFSVSDERLSALEDIPIPAIPSTRLALEQYLQWMSRQVNRLHLAGINARERYHQVMVQDAIGQKQAEVAVLEERLCHRTIQLKTAAQENRRMRVDLAGRLDLAPETYVVRDEVLEFRDTPAGPEVYKRVSRGWNPMVPANSAQFVPRRYNPY